MMDSALRNVPMTGICTNDMLVSGETNKEHLRNLSQVMGIPRKIDVTVRKDKCKFFMNEPGPHK